MLNMGKSYNRLIIDGFKMSYIDKIHTLTHSSNSIAIHPHTMAMNTHIVYSNSMNTLQNSIEYGPQPPIHKSFFNGTYYTNGLIHYETNYSGSPSTMECTLNGNDSIIVQNRSFLTSYSHNSYNKKSVKLDCIQYKPTNDASSLCIAYDTYSTNCKSDVYDYDNKHTFAWEIKNSVYYRGEFDEIEINNDIMTPIKVYYIEVIQFSDIFEELGSINIKKLQIGNCIISRHANSNNGYILSRFNSNNYLIAHIYNNGK